VTYAGRMRISVILAVAAVTSLVVTLWYPVVGGLILLVGVVIAALIVRARSRASAWGGPVDARRAGDGGHASGDPARRGVGVSTWMRGGRGGST
jgi:hypothetical protein